MPDNTALYRARLTRYVTTCYNERPDRVPLRVFAEELAAKCCGYSSYDVACNHELQFDVNRRFAVEMGTDAIQTNSIANWFGMHKALGWKGITFPGIGLLADGLNQWVEPMTEEQAHMRADEYDELIDDPTGFLVNTWMPRFTQHIAGPGQASTFEHDMSLIIGVMAYNQFFSTWGAKTTELINAGVVPAVSSVLKSPLDILGDKLRGYVNLCYDLHDRRDKVIAASEALRPHLFNVVAGAADPENNIPSIMWMHRSCVPFISQRDFDEIYWPTLRPIIEALWARGQQIVFYGEGNWDRHLAAFAELPEKSIIFHADKTDIFRAHEILGPKFCLSGGIPNEFLAHGTPQDVEIYCEKVIGAVGRDGGYIMDASALILNDAKVENVKAMIDATLDYGVYSQSSAVVSSLDDVRKALCPVPTEMSCTPQARRPGACIPWEQKKRDLPVIKGDETLARQTWELVDSMGYGFCWVNLTW